MYIYYICIIRWTLNVNNSATPQLIWNFKIVMESSYQDLHFDKQIILMGRQSIGHTQNGEIENI